MALKTAEHTATNTDDNWLKAKIYNSLTFFNNHEGEYLIALDNCKKAIAPALATGNVYTITDIYQNMATIYGNLGQPDSTIIYLEKCKPLLKDIKKKKSLASLYNSLAYTYAVKGNLTEAKEYALKSIAAQPRHDAYYILSGIYGKEGDSRMADSMRDIAYRMADDRYKLMILTDTWSDMRGQRRFEEADILAAKMKALRDELAAKERKDSLRERQAMADTEAKEKGKAEKKAGGLLGVIMTLVLIVFGLVVLAFVAGRKRRADNKKKKEAEQELGDVRKILDDTTKRLNDKESTCADIQRQLEELRLYTSRLEQGIKDMDRKNDALRHAIVREMDKHKKDLEAAGMEQLSCIEECMEMVRAVVIENECMAKWPPKKVKRFMIYFGIIFKDTPTVQHKNYAGLTDRRKTLLILILLRKSKTDICNIMGFTEKALAQFLYRLKTKIPLPEMYAPDDEDAQADEAAIAKGREVPV